MVIRELRGHTSTPLSTSVHDLELDMKTYGTSVGIEIVRVMVQQTAGSAAHFTVSIGTRTEFVTGTIHEKYLSTSTLSSGILDSTISKFLLSSDDGKIILRIVPDAGADNYYSYSIMYKR